MEIRSTVRKTPNAKHLSRPYTSVEPYTVVHIIVVFLDYIYKII